MYLAPNSTKTLTELSLVMTTYQCKPLTTCKLVTQEMQLALLSVLCYVPSATCTGKQEHDNHAKKFNLMTATHESLQNDKRNLHCDIYQYV